ncbi:hypothetical protein LCGC14_0831540 [marine sediment metagenome]|uniref:Uncharacterized protein n=1 Tax=marine sediment metagenome TaxID=412755 RepID=A0A0F9PFS8_9ZZZZ
MILSFYKLDSLLHLSLDLYYYFFEFFIEHLGK